MPSLAGWFLVAKPVLQDPSFRQAVVLLLQHSNQGAFGLVVNRPAALEGVPLPLFAGGPCESEGLLMLHGHADWLNSDEPASSEVAPGRISRRQECLERVGDPPPGDDLSFRLFAGYAGWGPDQLEGELANAWAAGEGERQTALQRRQWTNFGTGCCPRRFQRRAGIEACS